MNKQEILNSDGSPVILSPQAAARAQMLQMQVDREYSNALGYEIPITTLTQILQSIIDQKFFQIAPADYVPVRVGNGAWAAELLTYRSFMIGGSFEKGLINTATENSRLAETSAGVDAVRIAINNWAVQVNWSLFDLNLAARSGNWDVVTAKEKARKMNWDLGVQRTAFLGFDSDTNVKGLLTLAEVNSNSSLITKYISSMSDAEFQTFVKGVVEAYRANAQRTAYPDRFVIPEADYNGLASATSATFPIGTKLDYLEATFKRICMNPNFKILPLAYADQAQNADVSGLNKNRYMLYRYDEDSIRMDIPVDYTSTLQNSLNNFQFQSVAYGQLTGVQAYRPLEALYFDWAA